MAPSGPTPRPSGDPVLSGFGPTCSPAGGCSTVRRYRPSSSYSLITPVSTLETNHVVPSWERMIAFGVASSFLVVMKCSLSTVAAIGAPVRSLPSQPPLASAEVGKGPVYRHTPAVSPRADAT